MCDTYTWQRPRIFIRDKPILSSERMLHKDYDRNGSVAGGWNWSWITRSLAPRRTDWRYTTTHKVTLIPNIISKILSFCSKYSNPNDSMVWTYQSFQVTAVAPYWIHEGSTAFICRCVWVVSTHRDMAQIWGKGVGCCCGSGYLAGGGPPAGLLAESSDGVRWIYLFQWRAFVNVATNCRSRKSKEYLISWVTISSSRKSV
jgi:hypothetical protein